MAVVHQGLHPCATQYAVSAFATAGARPASWARGAITGLRARGGVEVTRLEWTADRIVVELHAEGRDSVAVRPPLGWEQKGAAREANGAYMLRPEGPSKPTAVFRAEFSRSAP